MKDIKYVEGPAKVKIGDIRFSLNSITKVDPKFAEQLLKISYIKFKDVSKKKIKAIKKKDLEVEKYKD